ncbi:MAG: hypothetical protein U1E38_02555 [Rhodospirillales bacterium]
MTMTRSDPSVFDELRATALKAISVMPLVRTGTSIAHTPTDDPLARLKGALRLAMQKWSGHRKAMVPPAHIARSRDRMIDATKL